MRTRRVHFFLASYTRRRLYSTNNVTANLRRVNERIKKVAAECGREEPRVIAVSKRKSVEMIQACYDEGHRDFGENYVQELMEKSKLLPKDIRWHFIGHLQSNKCKTLASISNLECIATVDSPKLARNINKNFVGRNLKVMLQINTSGEESKFGLSATDPEAIVKLVREIISTCPNISLSGLMTIGAASNEPHVDFLRLKEQRDVIQQRLIDKRLDLSLSMGMSADYEEAIRCGSNALRLGSVIFGKRK